MYLLQSKEGSGSGNSLQRWQRGVKWSLCTLEMLVVEARRPGVTLGNHSPFLPADPFLCAHCQRLMFSLNSGRLTLFSNTGHSPTVSEFTGPPLWPVPWLQSHTSSDRSSWVAKKIKQTNKNNKTIQKSSNEKKKLHKNKKRTFSRL